MKKRRKRKAELSTGSEPDEPLEAPREKAGGDVETYLRRLNILLRTALENPEKREKALTLMRTNMNRADGLPLGEAISKLYEGAISSVKRVEELEWKVKAQAEALAEEDRLLSELDELRKTAKRYERLRKEHDGLKAECKMIVEKKGEISKELMESKREAAGLAQEVKRLRRQMENEHIPLQEHEREISELRLRMEAEVSETYVRREEYERLAEENAEMEKEMIELSGRVKALLNELESVRGDMLADVRGWYLRQVEKNREMVESIIAEKTLHVERLEKEVQEKVRQINDLKVKIGEDKIAYDMKIQEVEAEYNSRLQTFDRQMRDLERKMAREMDAREKEIERLRGELERLMQMSKVSGR